MFWFKIWKNNAHSIEHFRLQFTILAHSIVFWNTVMSFIFVHHTVVNWSSHSLIFSCFFMFFSKTCLSGGDVFFFSHNIYPTCFFFKKRCYFTKNLHSISILSNLLLLAPNFLLYLLMYSHNFIFYCFSKKKSFLKSDKFAFFFWKMKADFQTTTKNIYVQLHILWLFVASAR